MGCVFLSLTDMPSHSCLAPLEAKDTVGIPAVTTSPCEPVPSSPSLGIGL